MDTVASYVTMTTRLGPALGRGLCTQDIPQCSGVKHGATFTDATQAVCSLRKLKAPDQP